MPPVVKRVNPVPAKTTPPRTRTSSVLDRIKPISSEDHGIKLMLYGDSGTGKTTLWSTFPGNVLAIVCSNSKTPGEVRSIDTPANRRRIKQVPIDTTEEFVELVTALQPGGKLHGQYETVVLDHVTALSDRALMEIKGWTEMPLQKSFGMARREDYAELGVRVKSLMREFLGLPMNTVIIAQQRTFGGRSGDDEGDGDGAPTRIGAACTPTVTGWLNTVVDYLAQTFKRPKVLKRRVKQGGDYVTLEEETDRSEYCLRVDSGGLYHTKFRIPGGVKETVVVDPTYDKIMALARGTQPQAD